MHQVSTILLNRPGKVRGCFSEVVLRYVARPAWYSSVVRLQTVGYFRPRPSVDAGESLRRGGSVCMNSFGRMPKWISTSIMLPLGLASAR